MKIIKKIMSVLKEDAHTSDFNVDEAMRQQSAIFASLGLDFYKARQDTFQLLDSDKFLKNQDKFFLSEHYTLFSALSQKKVARILEIGTSTGEFARFCGICFPDAEIITLDLPDDHPGIQQSYVGDQTSDDFFEVRQRNLMLPNIRLVKSDSFYIQSLNLGKFDLIWVDGYHAYPVVAYDICNAYHLLSNGGVISIDDIYMSQQPQSRQHYEDSYKAISFLEKAGIAEATYILKRFSPEHSAHPIDRKHIAILKFSRVGQ